MIQSISIITEVIDREISEVDLAISSFLGTNDCDVVEKWKLENNIQLRSWFFHRKYGNHNLNPKVSGTVSENASSVEQERINSIYAEANDKFPLQYEKSKKEIVRERIFEEIGDYDIYEIVADLSKRICLLERLLLRLAKAEKDEAKLPETIVNLYGEMIDTYAAGVENGMIKDRTDLENNWSVFNKLQQRTAKIAEIVEEEMYR